MKEKPIHYEPHPVSPERKAELVAQGVQIVDAIFAPPGEAVEVPVEQPRARTLSMKKAADA
jgi:hypothetical protein